MSFEEENVPEHPGTTTKVFRLIASCRPLIGPLEKVDKFLLRLLHNPSERILSVNNSLFERANSIATKLLENNEISDEIEADYDVVVAGGGFLCHYYSGVHSVLSALDRKGKLSLHRFSGASSGAQT